MTATFALSAVRIGHRVEFSHGQVFGRVSNRAKSRVQCVGSGRRWSGGLSAGSAFFAVDEDAGACAPDVERKDVAGTAAVDKGDARLGFDPGIDLCFCLPFGRAFVGGKDIAATVGIEKG